MQIETMLSDQVARYLDLSAAEAKLTAANMANVDTPGYRALGMRAMCAGEEAIVDPSAFTLDGRAVRKLRQSVHRLQRRGWTVIACDGREIDGTLETEIGTFEAAWKRARTRLIGFAMGMGEFDTGVRPSDLYLLARSPAG